MDGLNEFIALFGDVTMAHLIKFGSALVFVAYIYKKAKEFFVKQEQRDKELQEALTSVRKYPEYRQQSIDIQHMLQAEIQALKQSQEDNRAHLQAIEDDIREREKNKMRESLIQSYRHYRTAESWTRMEHDSFKALCQSYYKDGGNDYIHGVVEPALDKLQIIEFE